MAVQLTPEQEQRIQAVVDRGAYASVQEALDAAVGAVEAVTHSEFDTDLDSLLLASVASPKLDEDRFWEEIERATGQK